MATEAKQPEVIVQKSSEEKLVESTKDFWSKNSKYIVIAITAVVLLVGGSLIYKNYFQAPADAAANDLIWKAEQNFKIDSFRLALNGDGSKSNPGFLRIIRNQGGTKAGNLSKFYAGICYLQLGDFTNAVKYLEDFSTKQSELKLRAAGSLGDAYAELGKNDQAIEYYKKASTAFEKDELNSSEYLFRLGHLQDKLGKNSEAIESFKSLKQKFPLSARGIEADKYLAKLGDVSN